MRLTSCPFDELFSQEGNGITGGNYLTGLLWALEGLAWDAMRLTSCPFDELFSQEGNGITGGNYLTGLLWALEGLAWDEQYLVRVCVALADQGNGITGGNYLTGLLWALEGLAWDEQYLVRVCVALADLASHDPGGRWANRPSNSLATILLPWLPQTLASVKKRMVAVQAILREWPNIAWNLIMQLLPGQHQTSSGSYKPSWRKTIPADWGKGVTHQEYWQQALFYAELAVLPLVKILLGLPH